MIAALYWTVNVLAIFAVSLLKKHQPWPWVIIGAQVLFIIAFVVMNRRRGR